VTSSSLEDRFFTDAFSPAFRADPYPYYDTYRGADGLVRADDTIWLSFGHAEVWAMLRNPRLSANEARATTEAGLPAGERARTRSLLFMDPPDHTRLRSLVSGAFTPRRTEGMAAAARSICAELTDDITARHGDGQAFDLIERFAYPLPLRIICALLGVPAADERVFTGWSRALAKSLDPSVLRSAEAERAITAAETGLHAYLSDLLAARRRAPGDDLLSDLLVIHEGGGRISTEEVVQLAMLLLVAGHETTVNLIGNGVLALLRAPDQLSLLARQPALIAGAVDELLRFDSPVQINQRIATADMELAGTRVRAGDEIVLVLGAANRDPAVFTEPDRLDVTRDARRHVAFGGGIHHCLGASLARLEGRVALSALLMLLGRLELAGPIVRRPTFVLRGLESLPVALT
jgi:pimeloyl-[acyl-carrier protein] synthase